MKILFALLALLLAAGSVRAAAPLNSSARIQTVIRFENGNVGDVVDPTSGTPTAAQIWDGFTQSSAAGTWTLKRATHGGHMTLDNPIAARMWRTRLPNGTLVLDDGSKRSLKMDDSTCCANTGQTEETMQYSFNGGAKAKVSWGFYVKVGNWSPDGQSYDLVFAEEVTGGGQYAGFQFYNISGGIEVNLEVGGNGPSLTSTVGVLARDHLYWVTCLWDKAALTASMEVWEPSTWTIIGSRVTLQIANVTCADLTIGRYDAHQLAPPNSFHWIDNVVIDDTGANFPMFPGSIWRAASLATADVQAAVTAATAGGETIWLPAGSATWSSGVTFNKSLLHISAPRGTNFTTITTTGDGVVSQSTISAPAIEFDGVRFVGTSDNHADGSIHNVHLNMAPGGDWFRIHNCQFINGMVYCKGPFGVIYKSSFANGDYAFRAQGDAATDGQHYTSYYPFVSSSTNFVVLEDCIVSANVAVNPIAVIVSSEQGGIWMIRHCRGDFTGSGLDVGPIADEHGPTTGTRGVIGTILASNQWNFSSGASWSWLLDQRGGTALCYSNVVTGLIGGDATRSTQLRIANQDEGQYFQNGGAEIHTNSYHFRNTVNGITIDPLIGGTGGGSEGVGGLVDSDYIKLGITYFVNPPGVLSVPPYPFPGRDDAAGVTAPPNPPPPAEVRFRGKSGRSQGIIAHP